MSIHHTVTLPSPASAPPTSETAWGVDLGPTSPAWDDAATVDAIAGVEPGWGTATYFVRLTGVDLLTAIHWVTVIYRGAHAMGHPRLNIDRCPGCLFELAVKARERVAA